MTNTLNLSAARQDYLEVILNLTEKQEKVRITEFVFKANIYYLP